MGRKWNVVFNEDIKTMYLPTLVPSPGDEGWWTSGNIALEIRFDIYMCIQNGKQKG